jgi:hypothetical protein
MKIYSLTILIFTISVLAKGEAQTTKPEKKNVGACDFLSDVYVFTGKVLNVHAVIDAETNAKMNEIEVKVEKVFRGKPQNPYILQKPIPKLKSLEPKINEEYVWRIENMGNGWLTDLHPILTSSKRGKAKLEIYEYSYKAKTDEEITNRFVEFSAKKTKEQKEKCAKMKPSAEQIECYEELSFWK